MSHQLGVSWTRREWDLYCEQVRDSIVEPEIGIHVLERAVPPPVTFTCPFCLHVASRLTVTALEAAESFTAEWRDCGHQVQVDAPALSVPGRSLG